LSVPYRPKPPGENVNISKQSLIREFFKLFIGLTVTITVVYLFLGLVVNFTVPFLPVSVEKKIGALLTTTISRKTVLKGNSNVQTILDTLLSNLDDNPLDISVSVARSSRVNALAMPGGRIIIYEGLLEEVTSDHELAFVIGHEIGHFVNRDHLKGLGRGLSLLIIATVLGNNNWISKAVLTPLNVSERQFSREQEARADAVGLKLLYKTYGTTDGSVSFFRKLEKEKKISEFAYFFSSHPSPQKRIANLEMLIREKYKRDTPVPP
jgi:beta-barrel assembly-enhancing protease